MQMQLTLTDEQLEALGELDARQMIADAVSDAIGGPPLTDRATLEAHGEVLDTVEGAGGVSDDVVFQAAWSLFQDRLENDLKTVERVGHQNVARGCASDALFMRGLIEPAPRKDTIP